MQEARSVGESIQKMMGLILSGKARRGSFVLMRAVGSVLREECASVLGLLGLFAREGEVERGLLPERTGVAAPDVCRR